MGNEIMQSHNFNQEVKKIQQFANSIPKQTQLKKVEERDSFLYIPMDHKVTGKEFNDRINAIGTIIIEQNQNIIKTIKEFGVIYNTFNYLDNEYIKGIVTSLNAANIALEETKVTQEDNGKIIEGLRKTVDVLKKFKDDFTQTLGDLKKSIAELQKTADARMKEVENAEQQNKKEVDMLMEGLRQQFAETEASSNKKIKWLYGLTGTSLFLNIVLVALHAFSVI